MNDKYIIVVENKIIRTYKNLKQAISDLEFIQLVYNEAHLYQLVVSNGKPIK